jgi:uncharacterized phage protein (TIGR02218 family)
MSFSTQEVSATPSPIELYKFIGTDNTFFMTSHSRDIVSNGDTYESVTIKRDQIVIGNQENDDVRLSVTIPCNNQLIIDYAFNVGPPNLEMILYKCHSDNYNDTIIQFQGKVVSFSISGREAAILVPSLFNYYLNGNVPAPRYQGQCNHVLYDDFCKIDDSSYSHTTTISAISGNYITLASNPFSDGLCTAGELILNGRDQRRMIIGNSGTVFRLSYPLMSPEIGDSVTIRQGCDHTFTTCKNKFSNGRNYGGFPYVPDRNPFGGRI